MPEIKFKRKKLLTRPVFKLTEGVTLYVRVEQAMFIGKDIKPREPVDPSKKKEPATILNVVNLENGELGQIVCNAVLKSVLTEEYKDDSYVGKCFAITKEGRKPGKSYNAFNIEEIEDPAPASEDAPTQSAARAVGGTHKGR